MNVCCYPHGGLTLKPIFNGLLACVLQVTLHDCLACSGCITSAETVLLAHQSGDEFLAKLKDPGARGARVDGHHRLTQIVGCGQMQEDNPRFGSNLPPSPTFSGTKVVVSISAQSRTALAGACQLMRQLPWFSRDGGSFMKSCMCPRRMTYPPHNPLTHLSLDPPCAALYGIPPAQALSLLVGWLRSIGVAAVLDLGAARDLALLENAAEFIARWVAMQLLQCNWPGSLRSAKPLLMSFPTPSGFEQRSKQARRPQQAQAQMAAVPWM